MEEKANAKRIFRLIRIILVILIGLNFYLIIITFGLVRIMIFIELIIMAIIFILIYGSKNKILKSLLRNIFITLGGGIAAAATFDVYRSIGLGLLKATSALTQLHILLSVTIAVIFILLSAFFEDRD